MKNTNKKRPGGYGPDSEDWLKSTWDLPVNPDGFLAAIGAPPDPKGREAAVREFIKKPAARFMPKPLALALGTLFKSKGNEDENQD